MLTPLHQEFRIIVILFGRLGGVVVSVLVTGPKAGRSHVVRFYGM